jgi:hypothetical protein
MPQLFEDFLVELEARGDETVLDRLPGYLTNHYIETGNVTAERDRLTVAFRDKAPPTTLSSRMLDIIVGSR